MARKKNVKSTAPAAPQPAPAEPQPAHSFLDGLNRWFDFNETNFGIGAAAHPDDLDAWVRAEIAIVAHQVDGLHPNWNYQNSTDKPGAQLVSSYALLVAPDASNPSQENRLVELHDVAVAPLSATSQWLYEHVSAGLMRLHNTRATVVGLSPTAAKFRRRPPAAGGLLPDRARGAGQATADRHRDPVRDAWQSGPHDGEPRRPAEGGQHGVARSGTHARRADRGRPSDRRRSAVPCGPEGILVDVSVEHTGGLEPAPLTDDALAEAIAFMRSANPFLQHAWGWDTGRFIDFRWGANVLRDGDEPGFFERHATVLRRGEDMVALVLAEVGADDHCILTAREDPETLDRALQHLLDRRPADRLVLCPSDDAGWVHEVIARRGFERGQAAGLEWGYDLGDVPDPVEPAGFVIEPIRGPEDYAGVDRCLAGAFGGTRDRVPILTSLATNPDVPARAVGGGAGGQR